MKVYIGRTKFPRRAVYFLLTAKVKIKLNARTDQTRRQLIQDPGTGESQHLGLDTAPTPKTRLRSHSAVGEIDYDQSTKIYGLASS
jgi:hypothetical protein